MIFEFACRINSCTTFTPSPLAISSVANDLLKVCPALRQDGTVGSVRLCPDVEGDAKTQSWSARYGVSSRHICRAVTRASGMGIVAADGPFLEIGKVLIHTTPCGD